MKKLPQHGNKTSSGKFKKSHLDDDKSMRTHVSRMQVNNHAQKNTETYYDTDGEPEFDTPKRTPNNAKLDSDDGDYLNREEINFQMSYLSRTLEMIKNNNFLPYVSIQISKGEMKFLIDTGAKKNYIAPAHININNCKTEDEINVTYIIGKHKIDKSTSFDLLGIRKN